MWHPCIQGCDPGRQAGGGRFVSGYNPEEHRSKQRQNRRFRLRRAESGGLSGQGAGAVCHRGRSRQDLQGHGGEDVQRRGDRQGCTHHRQRHRGAQVLR